MAKEIVNVSTKSLFEEIKKDPDAFQKLRDKASWEHISLYAVLNEYGDPRKW